MNQDEPRKCIKCLQERDDVAIAVCGHDVCPDCSTQCIVCDETLCPACVVKDTEGNDTCGGECLTASQELITKGYEIGMIEE